MSYCRWSCDDYQCDVYCYKHVDGFFVIRVADSRYVLAELLPPKVPFDEEHMAEWLERYEKVLEMVSVSKLVRINGFYDGAEFIEPTAEAAARRLEQIRNGGYLVPQYAIDELRSEGEEVPE